MIDRLDHLVLTVASIEVTCAFYGRVLGLERRDEPNRPTALHFGRHKFNLHEVGRTFEPKAAHVTPGSADLCLVAAVPLAAVVSRLAEHDVPIERGPVRVTGALGAMHSVYFRDPDGNLIEVSEYEAAEPNPPA